MEQNVATWCASVQNTPRVKLKVLNETVSGGKQNLIVETVNTNCDESVAQLEKSKDYT